MLEVKTPFRTFRCTILEWLETEAARARAGAAFARAIVPALENEVLVSVRIIRTAQTRRGENA